MNPTELTERLAQAKAERDQAKAECDQAKAERDQAKADAERYRRLYLEFLELNKKLELGILGQKSERMPAPSVPRSLRPPTC